MRGIFLALAILTSIFVEKHSFAATLYEAENATLSGGAAKNTNHTGYSGTGFVDGFINSTTAQVSFAINATTAGSATVTLRYSAGNGTSSNTGLYVNGSKIRNITCTGTTSWDTWANEVETVTLVAGNNTIAYKSETSSTSCINLDYISVTSSDPCSGIQGGGAGLKGTVFGLNPSWSAGSEYCKATDGDINTYFDYSQSNGGYTGLDFGSAKVIGRIRYYPRANYADRMTGGRFQGSNDGSSYTDLYTISSTPAVQWIDVTISNSTGYRYVRYLSPDNSYGNIAEMEFYEKQTTTYSLTVSNDSHGTTSPSGTVTVNAGTATSIAATPSSGYQFSSWTVTSGTATIANSSSSNTTVNLNSGNATVQANFSPVTVTYSLNMSNDGHGTTSPSGTVTVNSGVATSISATPASGYQFLNWTVTSGSAVIANSSSANTTVTLSSSATIRANFSSTVSNTGAVTYAEISSPVTVNSNNTVVLALPFTAPSAGYITVTVTGLYGTNNSYSLEQQGLESFITLNSTVGGSLSGFSGNSVTNPGIAQYVNETAGFQVAAGSNTVRLVVSPRTTLLSTVYQFVKCKMTIAFSAQKM